MSFGPDQETLGRLFWSTLSFLPSLSTVYSFVTFLLLHNRHWTRMRVERPSSSLASSTTSNALAHHSWWSASPFLARRFTGRLVSKGAKHRRDCLVAGWASPRVLFCPHSDAFPVGWGWVAVAVCTEEVGERGPALLPDNSTHSTVTSSAAHAHHVHVCSTWIVQRKAVKNKCKTLK